MASRSFNYTGLAILLLFLNQCTGESKMTISEKVYQGNLGKYPLEMIIHREGNQLTGFVLNTFRQKRKIRGIVDGDDAFILKEFDGDEKTGIFEGRFIPGGEIKGTWSTPDGGKWFPIHLQKKPETQEKS